MYRPKDWNTDRLVEEFDETKPATEFDYFEAGADAMLGELIKNNQLDCIEVRGRKCKVVFIPDES